jgi:hypothetical protein
MERRICASAIVVVLSICAMGTGFVTPTIAAQRNPSQATLIPPLPATPARAIAMLDNFSDTALKAALAQPQLKGRVETLLGLGGCDWSVNTNAARQAATRDAATYLNTMEDGDLRAALTEAGLSDRIRCRLQARSMRGRGAGYPEGGSSARCKSQRKSGCPFVSLSIRISRPIRISG